MRSVVKVFNTYRNVSYREPWRKESSKNATGTASLIEYNERKFIITNEHVIRGGTEVHITVEGYSKQFPVKVLFKNPNCDLALLEICSEKINFENLFTYLPLHFDLPTNGMKLSTQGFPTGGQGFCTTEGIVSRSESASYILYGIPLLRVQISAPINPGSSGGLAITEKPQKVLGITSSGLFGGAQNVGYIIPARIIKLFLDQYLRFEKNPYRQKVTFPALMIDTQSLCQQSLRKKYELQQLGDGIEENGVLIRSIPELSAAKRHLKAGDILLALDDHAVRSDGKVNFYEAEISIDAYIASTKQLGDELKLKIWRQDELSKKWSEEIVVIRLSQQSDDFYILSNEPNKELPYYVHTDGAIFIVPDAHFVRAHDKIISSGNQFFRDTTARPLLLDVHLGKQKTQARRQFVYLSKILTTNETLGATVKSGVVKSINNEEIQSLSHLAFILENAQEDVEVVLEDDLRLILSPNTKEKETSFCEKHGIQKRMTSSVIQFLDLSNSRDKHINLMKEIKDFSKSSLKIVPEEEKSVKSLMSVLFFSTLKDQSVNHHADELCFNPQT